MNSINRILTSTKAMVAEFPLGHYLLSSIVCIILLIIHSTEMDADGINLPSTLNNDILTITQTGAFTFIIISALFSATILGVDFVTREFKEENRASRFLALPLSQTERTLTIGTVSWGVIPALSILPPFIILSLLSYLGSPAFLAPSPTYFLVAIPLAWASIILLSSLWLFPSVAIPKRGAIVFVLTLCAIGAYALLTRDGLSDAAFINYESDAFLAKDVVGMDRLEVLSKEAPPQRYRYQIPDRFGFSGLVAVLSVVALYLAAIVALTRKTA